jgi:ribonuclease-3
MTKKLNTLNQEIGALLQASNANHGVNGEKGDLKATFAFLEDHSPFMRWLENLELKSFYKCSQSQGLILQGLTHSSFVHENKDWELGHNERLEFLGDAVLDLELSTILWHQFPNLKEGELSRFRSALVNEDTLAEWALALNLDQFILLGKGESNKPQVEPAILADCFEALLGAASLINKHQTADLLGVWIEKYDEFYQGNGLKLLDPIRLDLFDPKTRLQEITLEHHKLTPVYKTRATENNDLFTCEVMLEEKVLGVGSGSSKKRAEIAAAKNALIEIKKQL